MCIRLLGIFVLFRLQITEMERFHIDYKSNIIENTHSFH